MASRCYNGWLAANLIKMAYGLITADIRYLTAIQRHVKLIHICTFLDTVYNEWFVVIGLY